jgi:hypothetical protein
VGNNPIRITDPTGKDWYQHDKTKYYTWYDGSEAREGYTHIGDKGAVLGEFESIIDNILTRNKLGSMYGEGFTFDIAPNDKGALIGSKERGWDFFDEFVYGTGPEFSVLLSDHPYTEAMKNDKGVLGAHQRIRDGKTDVAGQITKYGRKWNLWDVLTTPSLAKQFVGKYVIDVYTSKDGNYFNNVISDSKSRESLFYHFPGAGTPRRSETQTMGNTYQFYIWKSLKK